MYTYKYISVKICINIYFFTVYIYIFTVNIYICIYIYIYIYIPESVSSALRLEFPGAWWTSKHRRMDQQWCMPWCAAWDGCAEWSEFISVRWEQEYLGGWSTEQEGLKDLAALLSETPLNGKRSVTEGL